MSTPLTPPPDEPAADPAKEAKPAKKAKLAKGKPAKETGAPQTAPQKLADAAVAAAVKGIGVLATTAGFLAFIAATGAAITWVELWAAQLPADRALQVIPEQDLVTVGQVTLTLFVIVGLIAVVVVYAMDPYGQDTDEMRRGLTVLVTVETIIAVLLVQDAASGEKPLAVLVIIAVGVLGWVGATYRPRDLKPGETHKGRLAHVTRLEDADGRATYARTLSPAAPWLAAATAAGIAGFLFVLFRDEWWAAASVLVASALAALCLGVARATGFKFWPYGLTIFFSVMLFGAVLNVMRLGTDPQVEPAALIRQGKAGVTGVVGLFVAKTDDHYWLAAVRVECDSEGKPKEILPDSGRMFSIRTAEVLDDEVGASGSAIEFGSFRTAGDRALDLLEELVDRQPPGGATSPVPTATATPTSTPSGDGDTPAPVTSPVLAEEAEEMPPEDLRAEDAARVPRALAMTGTCLRKPARLIRLEPDTAAPGDTVRIIGTDLWEKDEKNTNPSIATLNGQDLKATDWTAGSATFRLPEKDVRSGQVRVTTRNRTSNGSVLTIKENVVPVAAFSVRPASPRSTRRFVLDATGSQDPDGEKVRFEWTADIGTMSSPDARITTYQLPPRRRSGRVTLTVIDDKNAPSPSVTRDVARKIEFVIPADVLFDFGEAQLTAAGSRLVGRLRRQLSPLRRFARKVTITGYADFVGDDDFNQRLSAARATTVEQALLRGIEVRDVDIVGFGETKAKARTLDDPQRVNDRRVEVDVRLDP